MKLGRFRISTRFLMDIHEAQRDINTIRAVAAGLSRKRDAVYVLLRQIYVVGHKWVKSGQPRSCATP